MDSDEAGSTSQLGFQVTLPVKCTKIKRASPVKVKPSCFFRIEHQLMVLQPAATVSAPQPAQKLKQMLLTDRLRKHLVDTLHAELSGDEPEYSKVLLPPDLRRRPTIWANYLHFLMSLSIHIVSAGRILVNLTTT